MPPKDIPHHLMGESESPTEFHFVAQGSKGGSRQDTTGQFCTCLPFENKKKLVYSSSMTP